MANKMKNYNLKLKDINPKLAKEVKEIIRTEKGKVELERSKKAKDKAFLLIALKVMSGQDK